MPDRQFDQPTTGMARRTALALVGLGLAGCASTTRQQGDGSVRHEAEVTELHEPEPTVIPPEAQAVTVVAQFLAAWNRTDLSDEQWISNIQPVCTHGYARQLRLNKPSGLPSYRVTGPPMLTERGNHRLTYTMPAEDGTLIASLTLAVQDGQWKVSGSHIRVANDPNSEPMPKPQAS